MGFAQHARTDRRPPAPSRTVALLALVSIAIACGPLAGPLEAGASTLHQQRAAYREAMDHLAAGRREAFRDVRATLDDYLLAPYLDFHDLSSRLDSVTAAEMARFRDRHAELPIAAILHYRWLKHLARNHRWERLLENYRPTRDAALACHHLRAKLATGRRAEALDEVAPLWLVGKSQPRACDPIFDTWIADGRLSEALAWERLQLALTAGETRLGRYLLRFFDGAAKTRAQALYDVHTNPESVARGSLPDVDGPYHRVILAHGLRRLAARDPETAATAWQRARRAVAFPAAEARELNERILLALAREGTFPGTAPDEVSATFAERMAEAALAAEDWQEVRRWIGRLPDELARELRWRYWLARALAETGAGSDRVRQIYTALAGERHYYGFLAAQRLGRPARLNDATPAGAPGRGTELRRRPEIRRALELFLVGDRVNARREWQAFVPKLDIEEQYHAARLAQQVGWFNQGIHTASAAQLRDTLALRFPVAYQELFARTSATTTVPQPLLLAVARQESAFDARARSHADARGLMQLVPPTAELVARRAGLASPSRAELYDPALNVRLGGHHLARLLERYDEHAIAAAAYNAGERRVDRWLEEHGERSLDVWIETIPYRETRNYVKNVLAFTQVYGQILDQPLPMLSGHRMAVN
ncbi:MAG: transglycosylase SLT domain-containing protein [Pseudomonadota bacterium]